QIRLGLARMCHAFPHHGLAVRRHSARVRFCRGAARGPRTVRDTSGSGHPSAGGKRPQATERGAAPTGAATRVVRPRRRGGNSTRSRKATHPEATHSEATHPEATWGEPCREAARPEIARPEIARAEAAGARGEARALRRTCRGNADRGAAGVWQGAGG